MHPFECMQGVHVLALTMADLSQGMWPGSKQQEEQKSVDDSKEL